MAPPELPIPIPTQVTGWAAWNTWLLVGLNLFGGGAVVAFIKVWPRIKEIALKARRDDMDDLREQIRELRADANELRTKLDKAVEKAHGAEMQAATTLNILALALQELEKLDPNNSALKLAREMIPPALTGESSFDSAIIKLPQRAHK